VRLTLPTIELGGMFLSFARLIAFAVALLVTLGLYLFCGTPTWARPSAPSRRTATRWR